MKCSRPIMHSLWSTALLFGGLAHTQSAVAGGVVVALDCEPIPGLTRSYHNLRLGADINDARTVVYADRNALYARDLNLFGPPQVVAQLRSRAGGGNLISEFFDHIRINEQGCVAFLAGLNGGCYTILDCGETDDQIEMCATAIGIVRGRCTSLETVFTQSATNPVEIYDFDLLESQAKVVAALGPGVTPEETPQVKIFGGGFGSAPGTIIAQGGDPAPEMSGTFLLGSPPASAFKSVSSGDFVPEGFTAEVDTGPEYIHTLASLHHDTIVDCDALWPDEIGEHIHSEIDLGCVGCFGSNDQSIVHLVALDEQPPGSACQGIGGSAYVETDVANDLSLLLLKSNEPYATLNGGQIEQMDRRASASELDNNTVNGVAVFAAKYDPLDGSDAVNALFVCTGPGTVYVMLKEGDPLPAPYDDHYFTEFGDPRINTEGDVVFWAGHDQPCNNPPVTNCGGVFAYDLDAFLAGLP